MNLPSVKQYATEIATLLGRVDEFQQGIHSLTAIARSAEASGNRQEQLQAVNQRAEIEKALIPVVRGLLDAARRQDVEAARTLVSDLSARIQLAEEDFTKWRRLLAQFEFEVETRGFAAEPEAGAVPNGFTRAMAEAELEKAKLRVEKRVELAARAVPDRPVVLV